MKVQFDAGRVRLRVGREELATLRATGALSASIEWSGGGWRVDVVVGDEAASAAGATLRVAFGAAELAELEARLPAREGIGRQLDVPGGVIDVLFEVDLHDGRRRVR